MCRNLLDCEGRNTNIKMELAYLAVFVQWFRLTCSEGIAYRSEVSGRRTVRRSPLCVPQNTKHFFPAYFYILLKSPNHFAITNIASDQRFGLVHVGL